MPGHGVPSKLMRLALVGPVVLLTVAVLLGCSGHKTPLPPAPEVSVLTVKPGPATFTEDYVAQTEAINTVEIRPRVGGVLEKQLPIEGERVKAGELLFVIDPQPYIEALAQARASLAQSEASLEQSQRDLVRAQSLSEIDAVSQQELDAAVAKNKANVASVAAGTGGGQDGAAESGLHQHHEPDRRHHGPRAAARRRHWRPPTRTLLTTVYETEPHVRELQHQRAAPADPAAPARARAQPEHQGGRRRSGCSSADGSRIPAARRS